MYPKESIGNIILIVKSPCQKKKIATTYLSSGGRGPSRPHLSVSYKAVEYQYYL